MSSTGTSMQTLVGQRLRARRHALGITAKELAEASGLSARYVLQAEHGGANLSLSKMVQLCAALDRPISWLVVSEARARLEDLLMERTGEELARLAESLAGEAVRRPHITALLGVRGAGKSTVGRRVAKRLKVSFIELDARIEALSGLSLGEIFSMHGEAYYRRMEWIALKDVLAGDEDCVLATGGSIVTAPATFERLQAGSNTIWLRARPEDHWDRVIQQGDRRPMRDHPKAMAELRTLLAERERLYAHADVTVETTGVQVDAVAARVAAAAIRLQQLRLEGSLPQ